MPVANVCFQKQTGNRWHQRLARLGIAPSPPPRSAQLDQPLSNKAGEICELEAATAEAGQAHDSGNGNQRPSPASATRGSSRGMNCPRCQDTPWVCEARPDKPMDHDNCKGAGMPCPICNPSSQGKVPILPPDFEIDRG